MSTKAVPQKAPEHCTSSVGRDSSVGYSPADVTVFFPSLLTR